MYDSITISAQLLALADRLGFGKICNEENADKRYRHFTARTQLYAMMIAQLTEQKGLRTIEETIASDNDLYHAGVSSHITRTNLAHANEKRPCGIFQKFYFHLIEHYKFLCGRGSRKEMKNLKLIDATTISLNMNDFSWAKFRKTKGGGAVLQEDKAEPPRQEVLRAERERRQNTDLDCTDCSPAISDSES